MSLHLYTYGSYAIGTHVVFPELHPARDVSPSVFFRVHRKPGRAAAPLRRVREWRTKDGEVLAALHEAADSYVIHFMRLARFQVSRDCSMVRCTPFRSCSPALMRHLFLDQIMPLLLSLTGEWVMHASAVEHEGRAIAFVGDSGAGKSTMAATFGRAAGRILADDSVMVRETAGQFLVSAPYASLRLWEDSAAALRLGRGQAAHRNGKRRFLRSSQVSFAAGPLPLDAICVLDRTNSRDGAAALCRMSAADALVLLVKSTFKFDISQRSFLEREFRFLSHLVASVPCYRLTVPDSLDELPSLRQLVIDAVHGGRTRRIA